MQKNWFGILLIVFIIFFGPFVYSKLADNEKLRLEKCPIGTYVTPWGDSLKSYTCYEIELKENASWIGIDVKCDRFEIYPVWLPNNSDFYSDVKRMNYTSYILNNFRFDKSKFYIVDCFLDNIKIKDVYLNVNLSSIRPTMTEAIENLTTRINTLETETEKGKEIDYNQTGRIDVIKEELKCEDKIESIFIIVGFLIILGRIIFRKDIEDIITKKFWKLVFKSKFFWVLTILVTIAILIINLNLFDSKISLCKFVDWIDL